MYFDILKTVNGNYVFFSDGKSIKKIEYIDHEDYNPCENSINEERPEIVEAKRQFTEYFKGERKEFTFDISPEGTEFQKEVWRELLKIPYGQTTSYGEIARNIGNEKASRAVGMAVGKNPIIIAIPCHRVIGKNGKLTGFSAGIDLKKELLRIESPLFVK